MSSLWIWFTPAIHCLARKLPGLHSHRAFSVECKCLTLESTTALEYEVRVLDKQSLKLEDHI